MSAAFIPDKIPSLWLCLLLDGVGCVSYFVPTGEWTDAVWAPIAAYLFYLLFGGKLGKTGMFVSFLEEVLPFTDFLPTFTIGYLYGKYQLKEKEVVKRTEKR